jgi:hypothetical protein
MEDLIEFLLVIIIVSMDLIKVLIMIYFLENIENVLLVESVVVLLIIQSFIILSMGLRFFHADLIVLIKKLISRN